MIFKLNHVFFFAWLKSSCSWYPSVVVSSDSGKRGSGTTRGFLRWSKRNSGFSREGNYSRLFGPDVFCLGVKETIDALCSSPPVLWTGRGFEFVEFVPFVIDGFFSFLIVFYFSLLHRLHLINFNMKIFGYSFYKLRYE